MGHGKAQRAERADVQKIAPRNPVASGNGTVASDLKHSAAERSAVRVLQSL
jgi:hypothetical protein